jgi:hypothetical protein
MPLLDHFHPPLHPQHHWESFHSNWATRIADELNDQWLPAEFLAEEFTYGGGRLEIDVATWQDQGVEEGSGPGPGVTTAVRPAWTPPKAPHTVPIVFPDTFEVRLFQTTVGRTLVGAIELISPGNKDRPEQRRAFAAKCASYLYQGVSLVIIDIVTNRIANLHNEVVRLIDAGPACRIAEERLYAVAYRPVERGGQPEIDLWLETFDVGGTLPTLPLRLTGDLFVPVDFQTTYHEACRRRRLA